MAEVVDRAHGLRSTTYLCRGAHTHAHRGRTPAVEYTTRNSADGVHACTGFACGRVSGFLFFGPIPPHKIVIQGVGVIETIVEDQQRIRQRTVVGDGQLRTDSGRRRAARRPVFVG